MVEYTPERGRQQSWLTLRRPEVCFDDDGIEADPHDVTRYGYWDSERVAELLPSDYQPASDS